MSKRNNTPSPQTQMVVSEPVDLPDHFENWWATSRFHEAPAERYSDRKQLAWDAYYASSQASSPLPLVEAVRDFMPMAQVAFLWARETPSFEELERYRSAYWKVVEHLPANPSPETSEG